MGEGGEDPFFLGILSLTDQLIIEISEVIRTRKKFFEISLGFKLKFLKCLGSDFVNFNINKMSSLISYFKTGCDFCGTFSKS